jgi:hypothetical protein
MESLNPSSESMTNETYRVQASLIVMYTNLRGKVHMPLQTKVTGIGMHLNSNLTKQSVLQ